MKVRHELTARKGYHGKQGGERFRTILKYPFATDKAMKRIRDNDTSLWAVSYTHLDVYKRQSLLNTPPQKQ